MSFEADLKETIDGIAENFAALEARNEKRHDEERQYREDLERKFNMQRVTGNPGAADLPQHKWYDAKTKTAVPVLAHKQRLSDLEGNQLADTKQLPSIGRVLRGIVLGGRADDSKELAEERKALSIDVDPSGGYTVGSALSSQWIDLLRSQMVLSQAGAVTLPMTAGEMTLARVTADPVVSWHGENNNIAAADPTFGAVTLYAKTVLCLVKLSVELSQDSVNIEQILQSTLTNATALAIDSAGLNGITVNAAAAPTGIMNLSGRNTVTSVGSPASWDFLVDGMYELMADNVSMDSIGALIAHPSLWRKMRKLKTGIA